jgi:hypothetical protein
MFLSYLRFTIMKIAKYFILFIFIMQDKKKKCHGSAIKWYMPVIL